VGETRIAHRFRTGPGGKGFNQAVACHRQGIQTLFLGAVGQDIFQKHVRDFAKKEHMHIELEEHPDSYTGAASIGVDRDGKNQIVVALGANEKLTPAHIEKFRQKIQKSDVLVCQLESNLEATDAALNIAKKSGVITVLNPAPINEDFDQKMLCKVDILTPNESEFRWLMAKLFHTKLPQEYWKSTKEYLHKLCTALCVPTTVLTLGEEGCFVSHQCQIEGKKHSIDEKERYYAVSTHSVQAVDTTGAGDAFNGGLAAGLITCRNNFRKAIELATAVAALSVTKPGTAPSMPHKNDVKNFLLQQSPAILKQILTA